MTNNEAAKWIQIFIDEMNRDLIEELGLCLSEKTQKMMKAIEMGRDALTAQPETHEKRTETHSCDLTNSQQAINVLKGLEQSLDDYCELNDEGKAAFRMAITALELFGNSEQMPSAQPEIIYCKDCVKHNKGHGRYLDGTFIGIKDCCPLVEIRGMAQGHEFDYQYCVYAERRTDGV